MAVQQLQLLCDQSTFANFFQWANPIDTWFATNTWIQSADTGQWMRSGMSITAVAVSGSNMTCTYTSLTGAALQVGQALTVTGWTGGNTGNNGTFVITSLGGGTWTAVNASAVVVASSGTGVVTAASAVPGSGAFFNSIWQPNDGLANFYLKMEYGNFTAQTNVPTVQISIGTGTNGAGTLTGTVLGPYKTNVNTYTAPSTTVPYDCRFTASPGRMAVLLWRLGGNNCSQMFSIERSLNSSGTYTGTHVTLIMAGCSGATSQQSGTQQSLVFGVGVAVAQSVATTNNHNGGLAIRTPNSGNSTNQLFNNAVPFDLVSPLVTGYDYPLTNVGMVPGLNSSEGMIFSATVYGFTRTYIMTASGFLPYAFYAAANVPTMCMRYD